MNKQIKLIQDSKEYQDYLKNYVHSYEVASLMGLNPLETKETLVQKKISGNELQQREPKIYNNKKIEQEALLFFNLKMKKKYLSTIFVHDIFASYLDGYNEDSNSLLKIKCPLYSQKKVWNNFFNKEEIPINDWVQMQCQIFCSECFKAYFLVYFNNQNYKFIEVVRDKNFIQKMILEARLFKVNIDNILKDK